MAKAVISCVHQDKEWADQGFYHFLRDGAVIGAAKHAKWAAMRELVVYHNGTPKYTLKEDSRTFWFFYHWLYLISFAVQFFLAHRYKIFEDGKEVGFSREKRTKPPRTFLIHGKEYCLFVHSGNRFSLTKNGVQIALYSKRPEEMLHYEPRTYDVDYNQDEETAIIDLFCIFIDRIFFNPEGRAQTNIKVIVPHDPYPHHTMWKPKE